MNERDLIVATAWTWYKTPWLHQGRLKGVGVDCLGLIIGVARERGYVAPDFDITGYSFAPDGSMVKRCSEHLVKISKELARAGDVAVMVIAEDPQHLGLLYDHKYGGLGILHSVYGKGVVASRFVEARNQRFVAAFRFPGIV